LTNNYLKILLVGKIFGVPQGNGLLCRKINQR